ncbi:hypothetical protein [Amycolatopsis anabasis]|uniref:hypothetical protein n=1 Tax=Amycolatopsis anabasis TaxID=1840409 RepID=UPI00131BB93E|nr:hypothetical protein [Amycolatopsis anabasis]
MTIRQTDAEDSEGGPAVFAERATGIPLGTRRAVADWIADENTTAEEIGRFVDAHGGYFRRHPERVVKPPHESMTLDWWLP